MWKGNYLTREAESRISWEDARYWVNPHIEDGVYLLPGEVAEQIDTDGMFKTTFLPCFRRSATLP